MGSGGSHNYPINWELKHDKDHRKITIAYFGHRHRIHKEVGRFQITLQPKVHKPTILGVFSARSFQIYGPPNERALGMGSKLDPTGVWIGESPQQSEMRYPDRECIPLRVGSDRPDVNHQMHCQVKTDLDIAVT